jgi:hypothetical protein
MRKEKEDIRQAKESLTSFSSNKFSQTSCYVTIDSAQFIISSLQAHCRPRERETGPLNLNREIGGTNV